MHAHAYSPATCGCDRIFSTLVGDVVEMLTFPGAPILLSCARFRDHRGDQTIV